MLANQSNWLETLPLERLLQLQAKLEQFEAENKIDRFEPYGKQREFFEAGKTHRERLFMAGNQLGKTIAGAAEMAYHLTGIYPDWWAGRRWDKPVRAWAASEDLTVTRDGVQRLLVGEPKDEAMWGTGMVPKRYLLDWQRKPGVPNGLDSITVQHASGGKSYCGFKSYDQGRTKFQGETLDLVWFDEEPDRDIYDEGLTRTNATNGMVFLTFTPLKGMSDVVFAFIQECGVG